MCTARCWALGTAGRQWLRSVAHRRSPPREARHDVASRDRRSGLSRRHRRSLRLGLSARRCPALQAHGGGIRPRSRRDHGGRERAAARHRYRSLRPRSPSAAHVRRRRQERAAQPRRVHGCWILGRYIVKAATPSARIAALAAFRGWRRALLVRRCKVAARAALPSLYRAYVARTTREWDAVAERP